MIKVIYLSKFREGLDHDAVRKWWRTDHGQLVLKCKLIRRYVQNHWLGPLDPAYDEGGMPYHGCVEVWFDSMEDYEATMASPEWKALQEDDPNGFEPEVQGGFVTEYVMRWDAQPDARPYVGAGDPPSD